MIRLVDEIRHDDPVWRDATVGIGFPGLGPPSPREGARVRIAERDGRAVGFGCLWPGETASMAALTRPDAREAFGPLIAWIESEAKMTGARQLGAGIPDGATECVRCALDAGFTRVRSNLRMTRNPGTALPAFAHSGELSVSRASLGSLGEVARRRDEMWREQPGARPTAADWAEKLLERSSDGLVLVAHLRESVCGYAWALQEDGEVTLEEVGVLPESRRHGVGAQLVAETIRWARDLNAPQIQLIPTEENPTGARELYERFGFQVTARSSVYQRIVSS